MGPVLPLIFCLFSFACVWFRPTPVQAESFTRTQVELPTATLHVLTLPPSAPTPLRVGLSPQLERVDAAARRLNARVVLNGGYFDPQNGLPTSWLALDGRWVASPEDNPRLTGNPALQPFWPAILNRSELRILNCNGAVHYAIGPHSAPVPSGCRLQEALGAGPQLLPALTAEAEGFVARNAAGRITRDPIGVERPNARTAVGLRPDGSVLLVVVAQTATGAGLSLPQLADWFRTQGVTQALNLDGGSSSSMWVDGQAVYAKRTAEGDGVRRPVKSVLYLLPETK